MQNIIPSVIMRFKMYRIFMTFTFALLFHNIKIQYLTIHYDTEPYSLQNLHTTIVMDVGKSLNPAIDIGQVWIDLTL